MVKILLIVIPCMAVATFAIIFTIKTITARQSLDPEHAWTVHDLDGSITCIYPDKTQHVVVWTDLQKVKMETNDKGPFEPDVFWILEDSKSICKFPSGSIGEDNLKKKLFALPNFNLKLFIEEAALSAENKTFDLWQK